MKKKLLFVIDSLDLAGAEKSLVTLLSMLDYTKYNVDLQLFAYGHPLEELVPDEVTILEPLPYTKFALLGLKKSVKYAFLNKAYNMLMARIRYSIGLRRKKRSNPQKAVLFWKNIANVIETDPKIYDVAISYAQGVPTYYVAEKVQAMHKFAWINVSYQYSESDKKLQKTFYDQFNKIVAVSDSTKEVIVEAFPDYKDKTEVIFDINNPALISKMAQIGKSYADDFSGIKILTVGRLANQKGYDIALEACRKLKQLGINFKWYVLGKGPMHTEIKQYIIRHDLVNHFVLLGVVSNPYPYVKDADIYVQTSRFEGFGLAIAEARMLNVPVVTTKFDAVYNQMKDGKNGLVVDMNADAVCAGILKLIHDQELKNNIMKYLATEKKGNIEELAKFYQLIG